MIKNVFCHGEFNITKKKHPLLEDIKGTIIIVPNGNGKVGIFEIRNL